MYLRISNLGAKITSESLEAIFSTHGKVNTFTINKDHRSNRYALIEMLNENEANQAMTKINGAIVNGQILFVNKHE